MQERHRPVNGSSRRRFLAGIGTAAIAGVTGCSSGGDGGDYDVGMTAAAFDPVTVTVSVGEEVVWRNTSSRGHTVTAYDDAIPEGAAFFASGGYEDTETARDAFGSGFGGLVDSGEDYAHTFEVPGEYGYVCIPHEQAGMVGTVVVEASETATES